MDYRIELEAITSDDVFERSWACCRLANAPATPEVLLALVAALADEGSYEHPAAEYEVPCATFVAQSASIALGARAKLVLPELAQQFRISAYATRFGMELVSACGADGLPLLLETLSHSDSSARRAALSSVLPWCRAQQTTCVPEELLKSVLSRLLDEEPPIVQSATATLRAVLNEYPDVDLHRVVPDDLLPALNRRLVENPWSPIFTEALKFFLADDTVLSTLVDAAITGHSKDVLKIVTANCERLTDSEVERLVEMELNLYSIQLLGSLGSRAIAAIPRLNAIKCDPVLGGRANIACFQISKTVVPPIDRILELYLNDEDLREDIVKYYPDPHLLSKELPTALREYWRLGHNLSAMRGLVTLGPLAVGELPWLMSQLSPSNNDTVLHSYAIAIISTFGENARPAFGKFIKLLEANTLSWDVLRALKRLGPMAAADFLPYLEQMRASSDRWSTWERNTLLEPLDEAICALGGKKSNEE